MNSFLCFIAGFGIGWFLAPAFWDISKNVWHEIKIWWAYRR